MTKELTLSNKREVRSVVTHEQEISLTYELPPIDIGKKLLKLLKDTCKCDKEIVKKNLYKGGIAMPCKTKKNKTDTKKKK